MMLNQQTIEPIIQLIPGVQTVRVQLHSDKIEEIHILASSERPAQHIVQDVERVFLEQFNMGIDRRIVSIAQLETTEHSARIVLDSVQLTWRDEITEAKVELLYGGQRYTGCTSGPSVQKHRIRSVAKATALAIMEAIRHNVHMFVDEVGQTQIGSQEAIVVTLGVNEHGNEQLLVGCAYIRRDSAEATARAVLSAVNRKLTLWQNCEKN